MFADRSQRCRVQAWNNTQTHKIFQKSCISKWHGAEAKSCTKQRGLKKDNNKEEKGPTKTLNLLQVISKSRIYVCVSDEPARMGKGLKEVLYICPVQISLEDKNKKFTSCWFAETSEKEWHEEAKKLIEKLSCSL